MFAVQGGNNNNVPAVVEPLGVPASVRFLSSLISPLKYVVRHAAQWVWDVVVLEAKKDGWALTLLFFGALGIFPVWVGLAMAVTGVVKIALRVSKVEVELAQVKERRMALLAEKGELEKEINALKDQVTDSQIDYQALGGKKNDLEAEIKRLLQQRKDMIANEAKVRSERDRLQEKNEQLLEEKEAWLREKREMEEGQKEQAVECAQVKEQQEIFRGENIRESLLQRFQQVIEGHGIPKQLSIAIQARQQQCRTMVQSVLDETPKDAPLCIALTGILEAAVQMEEMVQMGVVLKHGRSL